MHQPIEEDKKPDIPKKSERQYICPKCGKNHPDGNIIEKCDMVVGRRGWRQLGVYDG